MSAGPRPTSGTDYSFEDIVDVQCIRRIADRLSAATGCVAGLASYPAHDTLFTTGEGGLCGQFPAPLREKDDPRPGCISEHGWAQETTGLLSCAHGLSTETGAITVDGTRLATVVVGGVRLQPHNPGQSRDWAQAHGYDPDEYSAAMSTVPVMGRERLADTLQCLVEAITTAVQSGLENRGLKEDAGKYRAIFDEACQFMGLLALDGTILETNRASLGMAGLKRSDVVGKPFWDTPWWSHSEGLRNELRAAVTRAAAGQQTRFEATHPTPGGDLRYVDISIKPIRNDEGDVVFLLPEGRDITERKLAEEKLGASEANYRTIFDSGYDAIVVHDMATGAVLDVNRRMCEMFGYTHDEALKLTVEDISLGEPPYTQKEAAEWIRKAVSQGPQGFEWLCKKKHGETFWAEVTLKRVTIGGQERVLATDRDITERKRAEEALRESEARYRALFESANDAIHLMDGDTFIECNSRALVMYGCDDRSDMVGRTPRDFSPAKQPDGRDSDGKTLEYIRAALEGSPQTFYWRHLRKDGTPIDVEVCLSSLILGGKTYIQAIGRDITERLRYEEERARLTSILDATSDLVSIALPDKSLVYMNFAGRRLLAWDESESIEGKAISDAHPEWALGVVENEAVPSAITDGIWQGETALIRKDGSEIPVSQVIISHKDATGELQYLSTIIRDISDRKQAEEAAREQLRFLESLEKIDRVIRQTTDLDQMLDGVIQATLTMFDCDRAWLLYPCDPDATTISVPVQHTRPEYALAPADVSQMPMTPGYAQNCRDALASDGPMTYTAGTSRPVDPVSAEEFGVRAMMSMAVYPKTGKPWTFGMHQCSYARVWTENEVRLFREIGRRIADGLSSTLLFRDLRTSQERLALAMEGSNSGLWDFNPQTLEVYYAPRWFTMLGYEPGELPHTYKTWIELLHPDDRPAALARLQDFVEHGAESYSLEFRMKAKNGSWQWIHSRGHAFERDTKGMATRMAGTHTLVTDRKRVEEELQNERNKLQSIIDAMPYALTFQDLDFNITFQNRRGYETIPATGRKCYEAYEHRDSICEGCPVAMAYSDGRIHVAERTTVTPSGRVVDWENTASPVRNAKGEIVACVEVSVDITERKRAEKALRLERDFSDTALDSLPGLFYVFDDQGKFLRWNSNLETVSGYTREEIAELTSLDFFAPEDRPRTVSTITRVFATGAGDMENNLLTRNGEKVPHYFKGIRATIAGKPHLVGTAIDITERKRAEEALRESEQQFRTMIEHAPEAIVILDCETGKFVMANKNAENLYKLSREQLLKVGPAEMSPPTQPDGRSSREAAQAYVQEALDGGTPSAEWMHIDSEGNEIICEVRVVRLPGQRGLVRGSVTDISERKRAEGALRESEQQFRTLVENAPEAIVMLDPETGKLAIANKNAERLFKMRREQLLQVGPGDLSPPFQPDGRPSRETAREYIQQALDGGTPTFEWMHVDSEGKEIMCEIRAVRLPGERSLVYGSVVDIGERKRAEEELRNLRNYLSNIIDSMPSVLVGVDAEGRVTQWNRSAEQETGIAAKAAAGCLLQDVFPRLAPEMARIRAAIRERQTQRDAKRSRSGQNGTRFEEVTVFPLVTNGVEGAVLRIDDITERVRLEEMMIQSEKMLSVGGLAAGMAHEINNPLAGMMQNAAVLISRFTEDIPANDRAAAESGTDMAAIRAFMEKRDVVRQLKMIHESGVRAAEIVRNMLSFARKSEAEASPTDLCELLDTTVALVDSDYDIRKKYDFRRIEIVREYEQGMPLVPCEASKIQQVFLNILKNGAEAMGERSRTTEGADTPHEHRFILRVASEGPMARIEIEDNGPGMDEATQRRVFEPFFTTKNVGTGTGLGLSVSYFIVTENHGGTMKVDSQIGRGAKFTILLPVEGRPRH